MGRIFDIVFWCMFAGVAALILGVFIKILTDTFHVERAVRRPSRRKPAASSSDTGWSVGALDTAGAASSFEATSDSGGDGGTAGGSDSGSADSNSGGDSGGFEGGGGESGGGGSGGGW